LADRIKLYQMCFFMLHLLLFRTGSKDSSTVNFLPPPFKYRSLSFVKHIYIFRRILIGNVFTGFQNKD